MADEQPETIEPEEPEAPEAAPVQPEADPAPEATEADPAPAEPVAAPDYEQPRVGTFIDVIAGPYQGMYGVYWQVDTSDDTGPVTVLVRCRDHASDFPAIVVVDYKDIRPSRRTGGR